MRLLKKLATLLVWPSLGVLWAAILVLHPDVTLIECTVPEAISALLPGGTEPGKQCAIGLGVATPFLEFSEDGAVSWGWSWIQTTVHICLWLLCLISSLFVWQELRNWLASRHDRTSGTFRI